MHVLLWPAFPLLPCLPALALTTTGGGATPRAKLNPATGLTDPITLPGELVSTSASPHWNVRTLSTCVPTTGDPAPSMLGRCRKGGGVRKASRSFPYLPQQQLLHIRQLALPETTPTSPQGEMMEEELAELPVTKGVPSSVWHLQGSPLPCRLASSIC